MAQFESAKDEIRKTGAQVVFVAAQTRGGVFDPEKYFIEHPISIPFLLDEDRSLTRSYGVYQLLALDGINIARPASFVIDTAGIVRHIYVGDSQWDRMPMEDVLEVVRSLKPPRRKARA